MAVHLLPPAYAGNVLCTANSLGSEAEMKCPTCQHDNAIGAERCERCAAPLTRACANCGSEVSSTARFCSQCGQPLHPTASLMRFPSPRSYTPQHLADQILTTKSELEGERKQVTVLFADIRGSMELLVGYDAETAQKLFFEPIIERMMQ